MLGKVVGKVARPVRIHFFLGDGRRLGVRAQNALLLVGAVVDVVLVFPVLFGLIERQVRVAVQFFEAFPMFGIDRGPDAAGEGDAGGILHAVVHRLDVPQLEDQLFRLFLNDGNILDVLDMDDELVPAEPPHRVGAAEMRFQALCGVHQDGVPHQVAHAVVDMLKIVQIDD